MIIICMRVFLKQITPFSDQHLSQPKFFAILMWSTKTWAYFKSYIEGINILVTVPLDDVQIEPEMVDTNVLLCTSG